MSSRAIRWLAQLMVTFTTLMTIAICHRSYRGKADEHARIHNAGVTAEREARDMEALVRRIPDTHQLARLRAQ